MQKFLSHFIIFIISVLPIVNASASLPSCENMMPESVSNSTIQSMNADSMTGMDMASMHDCCETQKLVCDHTNACDCENSQVNYTSVPALKIQHPQAVDRLKPQHLSSLFISKLSDSLYRPPISTFI